MPASDDQKDFAETAGASRSAATISGLTRRTMLGAMAAGLSAGSGFPAFAEDKWPSRVVKLVCTYAAGGSSDISLRIPICGPSIARTIAPAFARARSAGSALASANT